MSAVFDTPLNGLGVIPLVSSVEGLNMSKSYRDALNMLVSACRGKTWLTSTKISYCTSILHQ